MVVVVVCQVLSLVAMEPPVKLSGPDHSDFVRDAKVSVLDCIRPLTVEDVVIGQYVGNGTQEGYLDGTAAAGESSRPRMTD